MLIKGNEAFYLCPNATGAIELPEGIDEVAASYFKDRKNITSVILPDTIKTIGKNAFENCTGLVSVTLPAGIALIDEYTFSGCSSLAEIVLPSTVTEIKSYAFRNCSELESITMPQTAIGKIAEAYTGTSGNYNTSFPFLGCKKLSFTFTDEGDYSTVCDGTIVIKANTVIFGPGASGDIVIPEGVYKVQDASFYGDSITSIEFPDTFNNTNSALPNYVFRECSQLSKIIMNTDSPPSFGNAYIIFRNDRSPNTEKEYIISIPNGSEEAYKTAKWNTRSTGNYNRYQLTLQEREAEAEETESEEIETQE
jgi:hypothetical protein